MLNEEPKADDVSMSLKEDISHGDQQAFRTLYEQFSKKLINFARSIVKQEEIAFEIVDDVFIQIWKKKEEICSINHLKVYLYTAVKNTALNYLARKAKENLVEPFDFIDIQLNDNNSPVQRLITAEIHEKIEHAINTLPPRCKIIFKLIREDGLKYKEVAEILNLSENTVDAQMVIAVRKISEAVKTEFSFFPARVHKKN